MGEKYRNSGLKKNNENTDLIATGDPSLAASRKEAEQRNRSTGTQGQEHLKRERKTKEYVLL